MAAVNGGSMIEEIGKVKLDLSKYPGEDFYCDGTVEDEILDIVRNCSVVEYQRIIEERMSWPILYHLSSLRENIVDYLPIRKTDKVLEVGSGCGAITGALAKKAGSVTCVDLSKKRSMINAYRHSECENVTIHVGNFKDIEPDLPADYDYICLIGVFEYGQSYIGGDKPYVEFLNILKKHLAEGGRIVIAIENKYGLKYFAGCKEDHLGSFFSGIENYATGGGVRTFSRNGLEEIFKECGMKDYTFYYPYPDYKVMTTVFSDKRLPAMGELSNNMRNYDRDRMLLFDEKHAFDGMVKDGLFPVFSNSYVAVLGEELPLDYVRYSNDRAQEYRIKTVICEKEQGVREVRKYPLTEDAKEHIRSMAVAYEGLQKRYEGSRLAVNKCTLVENDEELYASFEFVQGRPLSELMDECLEKQDVDGFHQLFDAYLERIGYNEEYPIADFDPVFSNIMVDEENWTLIDYEWTFGKAMETKELAFRAIYCYILEDERRDALQLDRILDKLGITEEDAEGYRKQEKEFQRFVNGKSKSMGEIWSFMRGKLYNPISSILGEQAEQNILRVQIYEDNGKGYQEDESVFLSEVYTEKNLVEFEYPVSGNVQMLRIDPMFDSCMCHILEMTLNGMYIPWEKKGMLVTNGKLLKPKVKEKDKSKEEGKDGPTIVFPTQDPNININIKELQRGANNLLRVRMEVVRLPMKMAEDMAESVKKLI